MSPDRPAQHELWEEPQTDTLIEPDEKTPLHASDFDTRGDIEDQIRIEESEDDPTKKNLKAVVDLAAAFFGVQLSNDTNPGVSPTPEQSSRAHNTTIVDAVPSNLSSLRPRVSGVPIKVQRDDGVAVAQDPPTTATRTASKPIKMHSNSNDNFQRLPFDYQDSFRPSLHRNTSAPVIMDSNGSQDEETDPARTPPDDFIDSENHVWRAKYCVLTEGVLYFYRNSTDAECTEAIAERSRSSAGKRDETSGPNADENDLSKSPMARPALHHLESAVSSESGGTESDCMWEKRVYLDCVGVVRSAEQEYGANSFELIAVTEDEGVSNDHAQDDALVLRSRNQGEMKEWLFQFHRSLASLLRNLMDVVGSGPAESYIDLHFPHYTQPLSMDTTESPRVNKFASSPHSHHGTPVLSASLSHGHGRNRLHRKRLDFRRKRTASVSEGTVSMASTPDTHGSSPKPFAMPGPPDINSSSVGRYMQTSSSSPRDEIAPELSGPESDYPETERPKPSSPRAYVPPHLRHREGLAAPSTGYVSPSQRNQEEGVVQPKRYVPPHMRNSATARPSGGLSLAERATIVPPPPPQSDTSESIPNLGLTAEEEKMKRLDVVGRQTLSFQRGGCADPSVISGSILDVEYTSKKASKVGPASTEAFGCFGGGPENRMDTGNPELRWEAGAVSECGIRDSNEDAYLIESDLLNAFKGLMSDDDQSGGSKWKSEQTSHHIGLFALFDGHCGNQAARFATEKLGTFIYEGSKNSNHVTSENPQSEKVSPLSPAQIENVIRTAISDLDDEFCLVCTQEGRDWESGATALVAMVANQHLVIASLGDCRGVICRSVEQSQPQLITKEWVELESNIGHDSSDVARKRCYWKEVSSTHSPSNELEKSRIHRANGWITTETEIPVSQIHRLDLYDQDVFDIFSRSEKGKEASQIRMIEISRICGELSVSRALGDRDFKARFNAPYPHQTDNGTTKQMWDCPPFFVPPDLHNGMFQGDLVSNVPDVQSLRLGEKGVADEFLLLACDGLWDVMDMDDAVRVTRSLLFQKKWTAKKAAARLAELAIHLGSSDNITVIVIRFFQS